MLLSASEIIKKSWNDYTTHWHDWAIFSLLIFVPSLIIVLSGSLGIYLDVLFPTANVGTNLLTLLLVIAGALVGYWSSLAIINAIGHYVRTGQHTTWKENYLATVQYLWPGFYTSLFVGLLILIGILLLFVPGIIFSIWFYFTLYFVLFENKRGWAALSASKALVKGRWWATWWRLAAPSFVFGLGIGIVQLLFTYGLGALSLSEESFALAQNIVSTVISALTVPLTTLVVVNLFVSLQANPQVAAPAEPPTAL